MIYIFTDKIFPYGFQKVLILFYIYCHKDHCAFVFNK